MHFAFLGLNGSFGFYQIGGTDSYARRLALQLAREGDHVEHVHYGCPGETSYKPAKNIRVMCFVTLESALAHLEESAGHVITVYLRPCDRIAFGMFRRRHRAKMTFQMVYSGYPDSLARRWLLFADAMLYPFSRPALCMSPRLVRAAQSRRVSAELLLPPVPDEFFSKPEEKEHGNRLRVLYHDQSID